MERKHFIYGANLITKDWEEVSHFNYKHSRVYINFVKLFNEFGKNFDLEKFNSYIEKKLKK